MKEPFSLSTTLKMTVSFCERCLCRTCFVCMDLSRYKSYWIKLFPGTLTRSLQTVLTFSLILPFLTLLHLGFLCKHLGSLINFTSPNGVFYLIRPILTFLFWASHIHLFDRLPTFPCPRHILYLTTALGHEKQDYFFILYVQFSEQLYAV